MSPRALASPRLRPRQSLLLLPLLLLLLLLRRQRPMRNRSSSSWCPQPALPLLPPPLLRQ